MLPSTLNVLGSSTTKPPVCEPHEAKPSSSEPVYSPQPARTAMGRLLPYAAGLWVILLALASTAIFYGHVHPLSSAASSLGLGRCAGVPCFRGAIPGWTSWLDTLAISDNRGVVPLDTTLGRIFLVPSADQRSLDYIYISLLGYPYVTAGQIMGLYGTPCSVSIYPQGSILVLHYPLLHVQVAVFDDRLSIDAPVTEIILGDPSFHAPSPSDPCKSVTTSVQSELVQHPWRGFTSIQRYLGSN